MRILTPPFNTLKRWDFKSTLAAHFRAGNPDFVPLGEYVEEATELVAPSSAAKEIWQLYGVSARDGVFLSNELPGAKFKGNYKRIQKDWFFHNPTRANIGSIGRVPAVPETAITSPEYQVWRPRGGVDPDYIEVLVKSRLFVSLVAIHRVGAVKERLFVANLMEIPVPVLGKEEQAALVGGIIKARQTLTEAQHRLQLEVKKTEDHLAKLVSDEFVGLALSDD